MTRALDLVGKRFGRLIILRRSENKFGKTHWMSRCDCGNLSGPTAGSTLISGHSKSCGCLSVELFAERGRSRAKHHMTHTRIYNIWLSMRSRCSYSKSKFYKNYGGRGIKVCVEWESDFLTFYEWAMNNGYEDNLSIDRIKNDGNYEPSNCKWSTEKEQSNNTRMNLLIDYKGETRTATQWAEELNIERSKIYTWVAKGRPFDQLIETYQYADSISPEVM